MKITAALVKELRDLTGAGMMDCKKALQENEGDIQKSIDWLRKQGIAKSAKKSSRIAAEGLSRVKVSGNKACLVEINSETDFVAQNDQFLDVLDKTVDAVLNSNPANMDEALNVNVDGVTINDLLVDATATIGEKISFRRFEIVEKNDDEIFGTYMHMGGKISACVVLKGTSEEVAKDMAMQVASMSPLYVSRKEMPQDVIEHERSVQQGLVENDESLKDKPEKILKGIVEGRLSKYLQDIALVDQVFFKDQDIKCGQYLKENNSSVVKFVRYAVGEGMEKREENFAEEVAKQMGK
ncbi:MAG: translation elongation factor Ts [Erysipelotrichaceae bacterium]